MKIKSMLYYGIMLVFIVWCGFTFRKDISQIKFAPLWDAWDVVLIAIGFSLINYVLRVIRWTYFLYRLGHTPKFRLSALSYFAGFAFTLSPGKVGEMVRGKYLKNVGVPLSSTAAVFFVERLMDLLAMIALASLAVVSSAYDALIWWAVAVIIIIITVLVLAPWQQIAKWSDQANWLPLRLSHLLQKVLRTLLSSKALLHPSILLSGFLLGLLAWGCEGVGLMFIGKIPGNVVMDMPSAVGIYSVAVVVGALSFMPGGLGGTEAVMIALLDAHGYTIPDAILLTLVCRLVTLWFAVLLGWLCVFLLTPKTMNSIYSPTEESVLLTPLCVDLDGTLILSDLLLETVLLLIKRNPLYIFMLPVWLLKGKAALKTEIANRVKINASALPYNRPFLEWLHTQHQNGRPLWLCTASNFILAQAVADHLQIFTGVFASSDSINLSGNAKARLLTEKFGENLFDYCGNSKVDLAVWRVSQGAIPVNCDNKLVQEAANQAEIRKVFSKSDGLIKPAIKALRPHQWAKNILVFVPLAASHKIQEIILFEQSLLAFIAFSFCASSVYLLNDMLDLEVDRQHPRKCKRPFASGRLSLMIGFILVPILLLSACFIAAFLPTNFWLVLAGYYLLTLAYSFGLKQLVLIDTLTLAGLYTARIVAGSMAITVPLSFWLLLFSVFLFLSLALVKRYAELDSMQRQGKLKAAGRGYIIDDLPLLQSLGAASGYLCVLVLALYINSPDIVALYKHPESIWFLCVLLLYWISRVWLKTHRGKMHDDPVIFAIKDKISLMIGLFAAITITLSV